MHCLPTQRKPTLRNHGWCSQLILILSIISKDHMKINHLLIKMLLLLNIPEVKEAKSTTMIVK